MNPHEFSEPILTERMTLRLLAAADLDDVHAWQGDAETCRYMLHEPRDRDVLVEKIAEWAIASKFTEVGDYAQLAMELPASNDDRARVIGSVYFHLTSVDDATAEIGWAITPAYRGHGYAVEAARAVLDVGFGPIGLHRVYAELDPRNDASVALCLRLGMRHEAHFVENMMFKGGWADTGMYGILDREWVALPVSDRAAAPTSSRPPARPGC